MSVVKEFAHRKRQVPSFHWLCTQEKTSPVLPLALHTESPVFRWKSGKDTASGKSRAYHKTNTARIALLRLWKFG